MYTINASYSILNLPVYQLVGFSSALPIQICGPLVDGSHGRLMFHSWCETTSGSYPREWGSDRFRLVYGFGYHTLFADHTLFLWIHRIYRDPQWPPNDGIWIPIVHLLWKGVSNFWSWSSTGIFRSNDFRIDRRLPRSSSTGPELLRAAPFFGCDQLHGAAAKVRSNWNDA